MTTATEPLAEPSAWPAEQEWSAGESTLSDSELVDEARTMGRRRRAAEYRELVAVYRLYQRGYLTQCNPRRPAQVAAALWGISMRLARRRLAVAELVLSGTTPRGEPLPPKLPRTGKLFATGDLDLARVEVIGEATHTGAADRVRSAYPDDWAEAERQIAEFAVKASEPSEIRGFARDLFALLDQDGPEPDNGKPATSTVRLRRHVDGGGFINGRLNAAAYAAVATAIDALSRPGPDKPDSLAQRQADALVEIARFTLSHEDLPTTGGRVPQVTVTVTLEELERRLAGAMLDYGGPLDPEQARMLACDARVVPVVLNSAGQPLDVGRAQRTATPAIRTAVQQRDRGCAWPGCDRPPAWCDTHHIVHWADGGETKVDNLVMLCRRHHDMCHHAGWEVRIRDGTPEFVPPAWADPDRIPRRNPAAVVSPVEARPGEKRRR